MICPTCGHQCEDLKFGPKLRSARVAAGLNRQQLADLLGYNVGEIKRWELGWSQPQPVNRMIVLKWIDGLS